ncbi:hypothetical protein LJB77_01885 [Ruminococcaceae bacterium OttesenSCG-928-N02]|nr:hypothetical protein [Ruminococcaceae bacterium OttesenSCG-928-N02]
MPGTEQEFSGQVFGFNRQEVLDYIDRMHADSLQLTQTLEKELEQQRTQVAQADSQYKEKMQALKKENEDARGSAQKLYEKFLEERAKVEQLTEKQEKLAANLRDMQGKGMKQQQELTLLRGGKRTLEEGLAAEKAKLARAEKEQEERFATLQALYSSIREQEKAIETLAEKKTSLERELASLREGGDIHQGRLVELQGQVQQLQTSVYAKEKLIAELQMQKSGLEREALSARQQAQKAKKKKEELLADLKDVYARAQQQEQEIAALQAHNREMAQHIETLASEPMVDPYAEKVAIAASKLLAEMVAGARDNRSALETQAQAVGKTLAVLRGELSQVETQVDDAFAALETAAAQIEIVAAKMDEQLAVMNAKRAAGSVPAQNTQAVRDALEAAKKKNGATQEESLTGFGLLRSRAQQSILDSISKILKK